MQRLIVWMYQCVHLIASAYRVLTSAYDARPSENPFDPSQAWPLADGTMTYGGIKLAAANSTHAERANNREHYLQGVLQSGSWGCEFEAAAYAQAHGHHVRIWQPVPATPSRGAGFVLMVNEACANAPEAKTMDLVQSNSHYQVLVNAQDTSCEQAFAQGAFVFAHAKHRIDVPGDGNCLYYAMAYALDLPNVRQAITQALTVRPPHDPTGVLAATAMQMREEVVRILRQPNCVDRLDAIVASQLAGA